MPMQAALKKSGIVPSDQPVSSVKFSQALKKAFGYAPILHCHNDKQSGNSYIDEVMNTRYTLLIHSFVA